MKPLCEFAKTVSLPNFFDFGLTENAQLSKGEYQ
jgi:hypothetical protein